MTKLRPCHSVFPEVIAPFILAIDIYKIIYYKHFKCRTKPTWVLTNHDIFLKILQSLVNSKAEKKAGYNTVYNIFVKRVETTLP